jgi:hypothetical protein
MAGNIFNTTVTTLSENVANQGQATMVQTDLFYETSNDPSFRDIVIPANSQITRIAFLVTVAFNNIQDLGRYDSVSTAQDYFVDSVNLGTIGLKEVTTEANNLASWKDTGALDIHVTTGNGAVTTDVGQAVIIIEYIQNNNLTA